MYTLHKLVFEDPFYYNKIFIGIHIPISSHMKSVEVTW